MRSLVENMDGSFLVVDMDRMVVVGMFSERVEAERFLLLDSLLSAAESMWGEWQIWEENHGAHPESLKIRGVMERYRGLR
jgi:hypothetical protein